MTVSYAVKNIKILNPVVIEINPGELWRIEPARQWVGQIISIDNEVDIQSTCQLGKNLLA